VGWLDLSLSLSVVMARIGTRVRVEMDREVSDSVAGVQGCFGSSDAAESWSWKPNVEASLGSSIF
jgi:hypothetical protein